MSRHPFPIHVFCFDCMFRQLLKRSQVTTAQPSRHPHKKNRQNLILSRRRLLLISTTHLSFPPSQPQTVYGWTCRNNITSPDSRSVGVAICYFLSGSWAGTEKSCWAGCWLRHLLVTNAKTYRVSSDLWARIFSEVFVLYEVGTKLNY